MFGNIGTTLLASMIPIGLDLAFGGGPGAKGGKGDVGKLAAKSFLQSTGILGQEKGKEIGSIFSMAPEASYRTAAELAAGSRQATKVQLSPQAQLVMNNQKLATKIPQFIQNSTNPQIADFRAKHVSPTVPQGRKTLAPPPPKEIRVTGFA